MALIIHASIVQQKDAVIGGKSIPMHLRIGIRKIGRSVLNTGKHGTSKTARAVSYAEWAKKNKHIVNALIAKRNAAKFRATPKWASFSKIREIYEECAFITEMTGIRHEVDHIYPLQSEKVCGLHCEANLQILTKTANIRKHNRMPEEVL